MASRHPTVTEPPCPTLPGVPTRCRRRVTLYDNTQWFGGAPISTCDELVESVPTWVDGGFFTPDLPGGYEVLPSE